MIKVLLTIINRKLIKMKSFFMAALSLAATTVFAQETKTENDTIKPKELKEVTITQQKKIHQS